MLAGLTNRARSLLGYESESAPAPTPSSTEDDGVMPVLDSIRNRRSIFPRDYVDQVVPGSVVQSMIDAASWAPFHGPVAPWRFVVLGKSSMAEMQRLTLEFYDKNWQETGWANGEHGTEQEYLEWREMTEVSRPCAR